MLLSLHCRTTFHKNLRVHSVPAFDSNYLWIVHHPSCTVLIDPGDARVMEQALSGLQLRPTAILVTHKHWDHVGGVDSLAKHYNIPVYAPHQISGCKPTNRVADGEQIQLGELCFRVLGVPGHTLEHLAYYLPAEPPLLLIGDTLFGAGCGRLFEGTATQMWQSIRKLLVLPDNTRVYCAHEYTRDNLRFALSIEPHNTALRQRAELANSHNNPTIPTTLELEKATNPFCRVAELAHLPGWKGLDHAQVFGRLRSLKDNF